MIDDATLAGWENDIERMSPPIVKPDMSPWLCSWPDSSKQGQGFPRRFWKKWCETYRINPMLHLFCGSSTEGDVRIDIRKDSGANIVGDFLAVQREILRQGPYKSAFADPPYTQEFANEWGVICPRPSSILHIMREAVVANGIIGILHLQVLRPIRGLQVVAWHPVF